MKCNYCEKELKPLNPAVEEYIDNKFCIKIFGWKLMLLKDYVEMGLVEKLEGNCYKSNSKKDTEINKIIALELDRIC